MKINSITASASNFPTRLKVIPQPPRSLYYSGTMPAYQLGVVIVGTRKPTVYGKSVTIELSTRLAERGAAIISGLAHGVDAVAHQAAINAGGVTIAVLAGGLDRIYPSTHRALAASIVEYGGALIGENPPGTPPLQYRFLQRNRLVSGLGDILIVTEASQRSGTMNTVSHALEQGKEVYAVPGPITSAMSAGCNALIAQGATPITNIEEFVERLMPRKSGSQPLLLAYTPEEQAILGCLQNGTVDGESLQIESGLDAALYTKTLTLLELQGSIRAYGANRWGL